MSQDSEEWADDELHLKRHQLDVLNAHNRLIQIQAEITRRRSSLGLSDVITNLGGQLPTNIGPLQSTKSTPDLQSLSHSKCNDAGKQYGSGDDNNNEETKLLEPCSCLSVGKTSS